MLKHSIDSKLESLFLFFGSDRNTVFSYFENWSLLCYHGYLWFIFNCEGNIGIDFLDFSMGRLKSNSMYKRINFAPLRPTYNVAAC
jgi:hypothetical protein